MTHPDIFFSAEQVRILGSPEGEISEKNASGYASSPCPIAANKRG